MGPQWARLGCGLPELTSGQLSWGHAFFLVTTTSPSRCFSHSWVTQGFRGSDQDWPGCKEEPTGRVSGQGRSVCLPPSPWTSLLASARHMPCDDGSPGAPVRQDAAGSALPTPAVTVHLPAPPSRQAWDLAPIPGLPGAWAGRGGFASPRTPSAALGPPRHSHYSHRRGGWSCRWCSQRRPAGHTPRSTARSAPGTRSPAGGGRHPA